MAEGQNETPRAVARPDAEPPPSARGMWALGFVAFSLVALVVVPVYYGERVAEEQTRISDVLEPAAGLSSNLRLLKAQQMARMEGFLATEDRAFSEAYRMVLAEEDTVLAGLQVLASDLDVDIFEGVARLGTASNDWRIRNQRIFDVGVAPGARERVLSGYRDLQRATRELDLAIAGEVDEGRRRVENVQRMQRHITLALAALALLATLVVGRVAYRYRALIVERESRRRYAVQARREIDALLEATDDGVLGLDLEGRCISLNRAGERLLGSNQRDIEGRDLHATLFHSHPDGAPAPREDSVVLDAIAEGRSLESWEGAVIWRRRSGSFPARWSLQPMMDGGELRGAVLTFTDMTEIQEKEEALRRAIRQREDVVSIVSHDLRNPLGVTLAAADLLLDLPLDEEQRRRQAEIIRRSAERMRNLIEDLLDLSRIDADALVVRPSQEELLPIVEEARDLYTEQAEDRAIDLSIVASNGGPHARVDRDRIIQALSNLLDNAVRLTPSGGRVTLSLAEEGEQVLLAVSDTGPGIEPELIEGLFDRFAQLEGRESGSIGLGLTIVKGVAGAHDGEVTVHSQPGEGSVFTLRIPKRGPAVGEELTGSASTR